MKTNAATTEQKVLAAMPGTYWEIREKLGFSIQTIRTACFSLLEKGKITRLQQKTGDGYRWMYELKTKAGG